MSWSGRRSQHDFQAHTRCRWLDWGFLGCCRVAALRPTPSRPCCQSRGVGRTGDILKCSFKKFRTFYVTSCSYKFNNPFEVQYRAGHTQMITTQIYIRREHSINLEFFSRVIRIIEEAQKAVEQGVQYVTNVEDAKLWHKPK